MRLRLILASCLVFLILFSAGCAASSKASPGLEDNLRSIVQPYSFNYVTWEFNTLFNQAKQRIFNRQPADNYTPQSVVRYFSYMAQVNTLQSSINAIHSGKMKGNLAQYYEKLREVEAQKDALEPVAEQTIARQISETLASQGIYNPFNDTWLKLVFPPVNFKLEKPLYMLIVSPRDRIERINTITIKQEITVAQMEELENSVDNLNVSSLVEGIGGLGATYPSFVLENSDLRFTLDTASEEWLHQYLAFKPLGFGYVLRLLGLPVDSAIPTINETVAGIFARELGKMVYDRYYAQYQSPEDEIVRSPEDSSFDFYKEMREIRKKVDALLAEGKVMEAEEFMKERQQYLAANGYYIRKLNQAYFAFHGSYADSPASIDPIGDEVRLLRKHSPSLRDFLDTASQIKNHRELKDLVSRYQYASGRRALAPELQRDLILVETSPL